MSDYPKMIYRLDRKVPDDEGLKLAIVSGEVKQLVVQSEEEALAAFDDGYTDNLQDFIGEDKPKRGRKAAPAEPEPQEPLA